MTSYYPIFGSWPFVYIDTSKMNGDSCVLTPEFICVEVRISGIFDSVDIRWMRKVKSMDT